MNFVRFTDVSKYVPGSRVRFSNSFHLLFKFLFEIHFCFTFGWISTTVVAAFGYGKIRLVFNFSFNCGCTAINTVLLLHSMYLKFSFLRFFRPVFFFISRSYLHFLYKNIRIFSRLTLNNLITKAIKHSWIEMETVHLRCENWGLNWVPFWGMPK